MGNEISFFVDRAGACICTDSKNVDFIPIDGCVIDFLQILRKEHSLLMKDTIDNSSYIRLRSFSSQVFVKSSWLDALEIPYEISRHPFLRNCEMDVLHVIGQLLEIQSLVFDFERYGRGTVPIYENPHGRLLCEKFVFLLPAFMEVSRHLAVKNALLSLNILPESLTQLSISQLRYLPPHVQTICIPLFNFNLSIFFRPPGFTTSQEFQQVCVRGTELPISHLAALSGLSELLSLHVSKIHALEPLRICGPEIDGLTTLHCAAAGGDPLVVRELINTSWMSLDMDASAGAYKYTALMVASMLNHTHVVSYLERLGANVNLKDSGGRNIAHLAAAEGAGDVLLYVAKLHPKLLAWEDLAKRSSLHWAARFCRDGWIIRQVLALVTRGGLTSNQVVVNDKIDYLVDGSTRNVFDQTQQDFVYGGNASFFENYNHKHEVDQSAGTIGGMKVCEALLSRKDLQGRTALLEAADSGNVEVFKVFKEFGAKWVVDHDGRGVQHLCVLSHRWEVLECLLQGQIEMAHQIKWKLTDNDGLTAWNILLKDANGLLQIRQDLAVLLGELTGVQSPKDVLFQAIHESAQKTQKKSGIHYVDDEAFHTQVTVPISDLDIGDVKTLSFNDDATFQDSNNNESCNARDNVRDETTTIKTQSGMHQKFDVLDGDDITLKHSIHLSEAEIDMTEEESRKLLNLGDAEKGGASEPRMWFWNRFFR